MTSTNPDPESSFAKTLPLILVTTFLFTGLKFYHIIYLVPVISVSFIVTMIYFRDIPDASKINDSIIVLLNIILVIFFKYILEMSQRKNFIRSELIKDKEQILKQSLKAEKNLSTLRKDLLAILAHDIRSPLANVRSIIGLASDGGLQPDEQKELMKKLDTKIATIDRGVNDLLTWVKSKEEGLELVSNKVRIKESVQEIIQLYDKQIRDKELSVKIEVSEGIEIETDDGVIKTVLRNLISNAIKYSNPTGKIKIKCSLKGTRYKFEVEDKGVGMCEDTIQKLSNEFFTTPGTNNEPGTGLGLQICFNLLERLNSKLFISSKPNYGTTTSFELFHIGK